MTDWELLNQQFINISFNDCESNRNQGKWLFATEAYNIKPANYDFGICRQYKGVITWSAKFYAACKEQGIQAVLCEGFPRPDDYYWLSSYRTYESKEGVCLIARVRQDNGAGDITGVRMQAMERISGLKKSVYGKVRWGGEMYRGVIGTEVMQTIPSSLAKLEKLNEYRFNLCFENCYHEMWSWDYVTEKIFDAFKAKTMPIYYGAYNIEQVVPIDLFIDFRKYNFNYQLLSLDLQRFPKQRYIDMTEKAFEFVKESRWGNLDDLKQLLGGLN